MGVRMVCEIASGRRSLAMTTRGWGAVADGWDCDGRELTAYQRAAIVALRLRAGERLRTSDVMRMCQMSWSGAYKSHPQRDWYLGNGVSPLWTVYSP